MSERIWRSNTGRIFAAPIALKNVWRFAETRSGWAHSVKPRFKISSAVLTPRSVCSSWLEPPRRVLQPWASHLSRDNSGASRVCSARDLRDFHSRAVLLLADAVLAAARFFAVFVEACVI